VSKYTFFWLGAVAAGQATWEQMQEGLARVEREKELERARKARVLRIRHLRHVKLAVQHRRA
jgi:hypothetical protein